VDATKEPAIVKVSVITPVFNGAKFVPELLESILNQDFDSYEHIVVNDGSTDNTSQAIADFVRFNETNKIRIINQRNMGEAEAINNAVENSYGEYLIVVNIDDPLGNQAISTLAKKLDENQKVVVAYPDWDMIDSDGKTIKSVRTLNYSQSKLIEDLHCTPGPGAMIRKSALERKALRCHKYRFLSDFEQWVYLSTKGDFVRVPETLATWRLHSESATSSSRGLPVMKEYASLLEDMKSEKNIFPSNSNLNLRHFESSCYYFMSMQKLYDSRVPGRRLLLKSFAKLYLRKEPGKRRSFVVILGILFYPTLNIAASVARKFEINLPPFILGLPSLSFKTRDRH
jgi:glycosyltransferase involved in cell wall biosynthesis